VLFGATVFGVAAPATVSAEPAKKLLFFGNSYTYTNDIPGLIKSMAVADGHPAPSIVTDLKGGSNLSRQLTQATQSPQSNVAHPRMAGQVYDFVIMQGHSHEAYDREDFIKRAVALFRAVRSDSSGQGASATAVLYQTWASAEDTRNSQKAISGAYLGAAKAVIATADKNAALVAPVGDAFGVLKFDKSLYKPDGSHPSPKGSLLSAMVLYRTLYAGEKVGDLVYADVSKWAGVTAAEWTELATVADGVAFPDPASAESVPASTSRPAK
jgi:lysophospholipase L1-like esterase